MPTLEEMESLLMGQPQANSQEQDVPGAAPLDPPSPQPISLPPEPQRQRSSLDEIQHQLQAAATEENPPKADPHMDPYPADVPPPLASLDSSQGLSPTPSQSSLSTQEVLPDISVFRTSVSGTSQFSLLNGKSAFDLETNIEVVLCLFCFVFDDDKPQQ
eukprot:m.216185 g.216185  ORF g.216185 m.216185 type:complete len:159 (-) comp26220_c0_seq10:56-532(-)